MSTDAKKSIEKVNSGKRQSNLEILRSVDSRSGDSTQNLMQQEMIFSLDIGTRSVVGVVGYQENHKFNVVASEVIEHKSRAMLNGQIHDIETVAEVAAEVRDKLEKKTGLKLSKVAIAAAGRVLKTCEVKVERDIDMSYKIDRELISSLEMEGIQKAQVILDESEAENEKTQFYCVGYSVINYYLNGYVISNLLEHKGKKIAADILATFLPHVVVDSLYTVMNKIGLEVINLTLEPIAAINVTIPKDLRLLNLALVDIGAGTSDIAITRDGAVVAYGMVPLAGDDITEVISRHYLLDFNTAEKIKLSLSKSQDSVSFKDIMGKTHKVKVNDILEVIKPSVKNMASIISEKILEFNHKTTNAVFLIGGGSHIKGLPEMIAGILELPADRVAVRGSEHVSCVKFNGKKLSGPESITPVGIAVTAQMQKGHDFLFVTVNNRSIRLFNSKKMTVSDSLILIGFDPGDLIGRSGKSICYQLNGIKKIARGELCKPAEILVNQKPANLETVIESGDVINVEPAVSGRNAVVKLSDIVEIFPKKQITFNGSKIEIGAEVFVNGIPAQKDYTIKEGDSILTSEVYKLLDLYNKYDMNSAEVKFLVNGEEVPDDYMLNEFDMVELVKIGASNLEPNHEATGVYEDDKNDQPQLKEVDRSENISLNMNNSSDLSNVTKVDYPVKTNESIKTDSNDSICVTVNGKNTLLNGNKQKYIFIDVFNHIEFDLSKTKGATLFKLNGENASFTDEIKTGDEIEIILENS